MTTPHPGPLPPGEGESAPHPGPLPPGEGESAPRPSALPPGEGESAPRPGAVPRRKGGSRHVVLLVFVVAALVAAWRLLPLREWLSAFESRVAELGVAGGFLYGALYVIGALLFVPGIVLTLGAGLVFGFAWGSVIVSLASTTAAALAFLIVRHLARARVEELARRNEKFRAIDRAIEKNGWKVVALLRLSPIVPFSISNYLYGLTSVRFLPYVLASWVAMLPATFVYVALGAAGRSVGERRERTAGEWALLAAGIAATALVSLLLARFARRELEKERLAEARS